MSVIPYVRRGRFWRVAINRIALGFTLLLLPMLVNGGTHMISDLAGLGQGFRDTNLWLAALSGDIFPATMIYRTRSHTCPRTGV